MAGPKRRHGHQVIAAVGVAVAAGIVAAGVASYHASHTAKVNTASTHLSLVPNHALHPGATNPNVTQADIASTICVPHWTDTIRPPTSYTDNLKVQQMAAEKLKGKPGDYEEDHEVSLELGGNPTDPKNLWPEPWQSRGADLAPKGDGAEAKDVIETRLKKEVCDGTRQLANAQQLIVGWHPGLVVP